MHSTVAVRSRGFTLAALALPLSFILPFEVAFADPEPFVDAASWVPGHFHVELWGDADIGAIAAEHGLEVVDSFDFYHLLTSNQEIDDERQLESLLQDRRLAWAELAYRQHTPESTRQMVVAVVGGTVEEFSSQNVYDRLGLGHIHAHTLGAGVIVAVIDTGIDPHHPALEGRVHPGGYDFIDEDDQPWETANGLDDDDDGFVDEGAGHGTMVAGIFSLVAPEARILPLRALDDDGNGTAFGVARAIHFATEQGVDIINLSLGLPQFSMVLSRAVERAAAAGIVVVAAAGNEGSNDPPYFPASSAATISVASLGDADIKSDFSNYHKTVSVSAPGESILAPFLDGQWAVGSGTSFAAPFISGQAALVQSAVPLLGKGETEQTVAEGTIGVDDLIGNIPYRGMLGRGRFDGARTWALLESTPSDLPPHGSSREFEFVWSPSPLLSGEWATLSLGAAPVGTSSVDVSIHDAAGRLLRLVHGDSRGEVAWNGRDADGRPAVSGVYFATIDFRSEGGKVLARQASRILVVR